MKLEVTSAVGQAESEVLLGKVGQGPEQPGLGLPILPHLFQLRSPGRRHGLVQGCNSLLAFPQAGISDSMLGTCPGKGAC